MSATTFPPREYLHSPDITHHDILDATSGIDFNALAELAAFTFNCPFAVISFTGMQKQWLNIPKPSFTWQIPAHDIFHTAALTGHDVIVITDVHNDKRFLPASPDANNNGILFYAGASIISSAGTFLGSLFIMDTVIRDTLTNEQKASLRSIAKLAARILELNVANRFIVKQADDLVEEERKMTRLIISEQEAEKGLIAHKLQEGFAQTLAATKLYLEVAEQSPESKDDLIQKGMDNISGVIDEIKYLCNIMVPSTLGNANAVEVLEDMVAEWESRNNMQIDFTCGTSLQSVNNDIGLALFRIIQQQLKLASYCNAPKAEISILEKNGIALYFTLKGMNFADADPQKELFINNIHTRVTMINGEMTLDSSLSDNDVMLINIPLGREAVSF